MELFSESKSLNAANFCDVRGFEDIFGGLTDPRSNKNKQYLIEELLFLTICAIICGCNGWKDIEEFGYAKLGFLREHYPYKNGVPSDDTLRRLFRSLDPKVFEQCFKQWVSKLSPIQHSHIAIDGKVSRASKGEGDPLYMVSAFASEARLVLGQTKVANKSNEITAIPELLRWLDLKGGIVTIDAMGCQRDIAEKILVGGGDYILALKGNQSNLQSNIIAMFGKEDLLNRLNSQIIQTEEQSHGRYERRVYSMVELPDQILNQHKWPGLKSAIKLESTRVIKEKETIETRYYISSLKLDADLIAKTIRSHWAIENSLHYILDVSLQDDACKIRHGHRIYLL